MIPPPMESLLTQNMAIKRVGGYSNELSVCMLNSLSLWDLHSILLLDLSINLSEPLGLISQTIWESSLWGLGTPNLLINDSNF